MTLKPVLSALLVAGFVSGCVSQPGPAPQTAAPPLLVMDGRQVPAGMLCEHLIDSAVNKVAGCEGFVRLSNLTPREAAEIASLNSRFAAEVAPIVNFAFDKADLTPASMAILDAQAEWMRRFVNLRFSVYGHTDLVGSEGYNFDLAKRRAEAVVAYLAARGVSNDQLEALVSYGETKPLIPVDKREALNRRTVTEVTGYVTEPRLRTKVPVGCALIKPSFVASYPSCIGGPAPLPPAPVPPKPPVVIVAPKNIAAPGTASETTSEASYFNDGTTEIKRTSGSAGNGALTTGVVSTGTSDKLVREVSLNGRTVMTVTSDPDGSNPSVVFGQ
jgi:hypothetical protein